jgi:hypothetical protein
MDTREIVARFVAERQALALMEHPCIARVFDGGATETGRPYFVMELVRGQRITDYCDQKKLSTRQRHNEPVLASPPSNLYRFQKMVRRNKLAFAAAGSISLVVLAAAVISSILFMHERTARKRATEAEIEMLAAGG